MAEAAPSPAAAARADGPAAEKTPADPIRALRAGLVAGLVTFGLLLPLIGFKTVENIHNELVLETRWPLLLAAVAAVALVRFLHVLLIAPWMARRAARPRAPQADISAASARISRAATPAALAFAAVYPPLVLALAGFRGAAKWIDNFGIQILIYVVLGWGLNIVVGLAGLLDLGYAAFYAVGAYSYALLAKTLGLSFWILLPTAGLLAALARLLLGLPVLRLRGDYLAIVTLAFGEIVRLVLINWVPVTNGYAGISGIARPTFFGIPFTAADNGFAALLGIEFSPIYRTIFLYYVILALALVPPRSRCGCAGCRSAAPGRRCARTRSAAARSASTRPRPSSRPSPSAAPSRGFAGSFFAARQGFISPESFTFMESAVIVAIVVLGGMGSMLGVVIAAVIMIGGTEVMRELDVLKQCSAMPSIPPNTACWCSASPWC